jgi:hypothetical protein
MHSPAWLAVPFFMLFLLGNDWNAMRHAGLAFIAWHGLQWLLIGLVDNC